MLSYELFETSFHGEKRICRTGWRAVRPVRSPLILADDVAFAYLATASVTDARCSERLTSGVGNDRKGLSPELVSATLPR